MHTHSTRDNRITIHHNSDWSGEVFIDAYDQDDVSERARRIGRIEPRTAKLPGSAILSGDYERPADCPVTERELRRATALAMYLRVTGKAIAALEQINAPGVL